MQLMKQFFARQLGRRTSLEFAGLTRSVGITRTHKNNNL